VALDKDPVAVEVGRALARQDPRFAMERASYTSIGRIAESRSVSGNVDGVLFDLGLSSPQLDDAARGFSFLRDGPLDMRMDPESGISAAAWLQRAPEQQIARVIREYGEERYARRIARAVVENRRSEPISRTRQLAAIVERSVPVREHRRHPATRTFQALRIFINRELEELQEALAQVPSVLKPGGRLAVVSFHSLEDRLVKRFIRGRPSVVHLPPAYGEVPPLRAVGKPLRPSAAEVARNPRARSAVLRLAEKRA
jgi:16S rRNA (cytosine1402-N4)-methyltransferase